MTKAILVLFAALPFVGSAQAVIPGYLTDPTAVKEALAKTESYQTPEALKYPYVSTYYVKPIVTTEEDVKVGIFVTDFESSKIRFLDDSHRFTAFLEYRLAGGASKVLTLADLKSGDAEFSLGRLSVGDYELRVWVRDAQGRESHRVIHDFRVRTAEDLVIPADKVYTMTAADLAAYGIRNDGNYEKIVYVYSNKTEVVKERRTDVPGYKITVPIDEKTGLPPYRAYEKATVAYDADYDKAAVEAEAVKTAQGLQKLLDEKAAAGFRKLVMLPGTYRVSAAETIFLPDNFTLDLNQATLKQNGFTGDKGFIVRFASTMDAHLVNGTLEGDYWTHDYKNSPNGSEWVLGYEIGGDSWYCTVEGVKIAEIAGYGGQNVVREDKRGSNHFFYEYLPDFAAGGLDAKTGLVDASDTFRFTTDFKDLKPITVKAGRRRLQISRYLGYQGCATRAWQLTAAWYDADKNFLSAETCWQYREMWIPEGAAFLRVSVEAESAEAAKESGLRLTAFRYPINCVVKNCRYERCRAVGHAAANMKNMLFEGNFFTQSGETHAKCAFDAEDGWDQMQDVYFLKNVFRGNPVNNSILTCAGHNFIMEQNDCDLYFWGRTHSPCVRNNNIGEAVWLCDSRIRSGYGRLGDNRCAKRIVLGQNNMEKRPDNWDVVLSGKTFDGTQDKFNIEVGKAGRVVGCTFVNMEGLGLGNAYACVLENCKGRVPNVNWVDVTVKGSRFENFFGSNRWTRCHFGKTHFQSLGSTPLFVTDCDFTDTTVLGFNKGNVTMEKCSFKGSTVSGSWWELPAQVLFRDCTIETRDNEAFYRTGVYTIGNIRFEDCKVSGKNALVDVRDLRALSNSDPVNGPDGQLGTIAFKNLTWQSESSTVVKHEKIPAQSVSSKKIALLNEETTLPEGVTLLSEPLPTWEVR